MRIKRMVTKQNHQPANELVFSKAQVEAHLPGADCVSSLASPLEVIAAHPVEAPSTLARPHA